MPRSCAQRYLPPLLTSLLATVVVSSAHADPLTIPGYTVTNLGTGTPTFSTDATGNSILTTGSGQVYAWQPTNNTVLTEAQIQAGKYPFGPNPYANDLKTYGNPANAYQMVLSAMENSNGLVAATIASGVSGHYGYASVVPVQVGSNGAWNLVPGAEGWSSNEQYIGLPATVPGLVVGLNNLNEILGNMGVDPLHGILTDPVIYNVGSNTLTDLATLFSANPQDTFANFQASSLDADGRILLSAADFDPLNPQTGFTTVDLLLTPTGLSPDHSKSPPPSPARWPSPYWASRESLRISFPAPLAPIVSVLSSRRPGVTQGNLAGSRQPPANGQQIRRGRVSSDPAGPPP